MRNRRFYLLLLPLLSILLLLAELGAQRHALSHLPHLEHALHQPGGPAEPAEPAHTGKTAGCELCLAYASLSAGLPVLIALLALGVAILPERLRSSIPQQLRLQLAFRSRAPPLFS